MGVQYQAGLAFSYRLDGVPVSVWIAVQYEPLCGAALNFRREVYINRRRYGLPPDKE
jgi:hypothetical protein